MLSILVSILGLWSCDPVYDLPVKPSVETTTESIVFEKEGGSDIIEFTTNREWTAKLIDNKLNDSTDWCTISSIMGNAGTNTITINVLNLDGDYREAFLLLNSSGAGSEIPIMQLGIPVVTAMDATNIDESSATFSGNWFYSGEIDVTEIGFAIAPESSGDYTNIPLELDSISQGTFSENIGDLYSATSYFYMFYVKTAEGEYYYSEGKAFATDVAPVYLHVKDLVARGKELSVGGSKEMTESEYIVGSVSNVVEAGNKITLSIVDSNVSADVEAGKNVANYGITITLPSDSATIGAFQIGDELKIRTKGGLLSNVSGNPLFAIKDRNNIKIMATGIVLVPVNVVHSQLNNYLAMYVAIDNTQVTKSYLDNNLYPTWSATLFTMEVAESEESYLMQVPAGAAFASDPVLTGSGMLKGIVSPGQVGYLINPRNESDLAGLTNERFISLLELHFLDPVFNGILRITEVSATSISIPYKNGDGSTIPAEITVTMEGAAAEGLSVTGISNPTVEVGLGELKLEVIGTPVVEGDIIFTILGFDDYLTTTTVATIVEKPDIPEIGNFEVVWDVSTCNYATEMAFATNSNPAITVSDLVGVNFNGSSETTKYTQDFATTGCDANTDENRLTDPEVYLTTTLNVPAGKVLQLSGLDITCRTKGGDSQVSIQYSFDGNNFTEIDYSIQGSNEPAIINLGKVEALKNVVEGSAVTFRIVPVNPIATAKWGINGKNTSRGLAIYGEVVDK